MAIQARGFVAYPSASSGRSETIEGAIENIQGGGVIDLLGWKDLAISGRVIIGAICEEIRNRHLFIADVTGLNPNVLFELGFAIANRKRIWLLLDPNIERAKLDFERFQLLTTIGYCPYSNSQDIVNGFYREEPYSKLDQDLQKELLQSTAAPAKKDALLYLKSDVDTNSSSAIARCVSSGVMPSVIDDPREVRVQPFAWYVQQVAAAYAVICHLLSTEYQNWEIHNAKHALVAGLAHGFAKPLIMLAHEPYSSPVDYRDLLKTHGTAAKAQAIFDSWLAPLAAIYEKRSAEQENYQQEAMAQGELRNIAIGDPIAEFESNKLTEYFVPTAAYNEALRSKHSIFVGRKGTGKTASLYKLAEELSADPRNHVCVVKPVDYELHGLLEMLAQELPRSEKGYLIESFWKFLLYTELAKSVYEQLLLKPGFYQRTDAETRLFEFVEEYQSVITPEFSVRLDAAVNRLRNLNSSGTAENQRVSISERMHNDMLARLRALLGGTLSDKERVAILVDNLDKAWNQRTDFQMLSELIFGLLSVSGRVAEEFEKESHWRNPVNLSLTLFLRSDIYAAMIRYARERDKLPIRRMTWEDSELLRRVLQERFVSSGADVVRPDGIWDRYFPATVRGVPMQEYLADAALPRPRDLIYLVKTALQFAVNRGHTRIEEKDLIAAEDQYSRFALDSLLVESGTRVPRLDELIYEFVRSTEIITEQDILRAMHALGIPDNSLNDAIETLCEITFLGLEVGPGRFAYLYDEDSTTKITVMARKTATEHQSGLYRYRINKVFHAYLEIQPNEALNPAQMTMELPESAGNA
ncbi:MAG: P-loop ATPase, Sll1717 family [Terriglobales bacterium]